MIRAKNYETVCKFVKVMTKILWPLFFRTRCILWYIVWTRFHTNLTFTTLLYTLENFESFESNFLDLTKVGLTWLFH